MQMFKNFLGSNFLHCRYVMKSGILNEEEKNSLFMRFILGKRSKFKTLVGKHCSHMDPQCTQVARLDRRFRKITCLFVILPVFL